jgi:hypothetical protein
MDMKDSGNRRQFESGAVRDRDDSKPRPDLISPHANWREGAWLALGAKKYKPRNWELGIGISECVASLCRHVELYRLGLQDEDHMAAVRTNAGFILHFEEEIKAGRLPAALDDMPHYLTRPSQPPEDILKLRDRAERGEMLSDQENDRLQTALAGARSQPPVAEAKVQPSFAERHGLGVFAAEDIPAGAPVRIRDGVMSLDTKEEGTAVEELNRLQPGKRGCGNCRFAHRRVSEPPCNVCADTDEYPHWQPAVNHPQFGKGDHCAAGSIFPATVDIQNSPGAALGFVASMDAATANDRLPPMHDADGRVSDGSIYAATSRHDQARVPDGTVVRVNEREHLIAQECEAADRFHAAMADPKVSEVQTGRAYKSLAKACDAVSRHDQACTGTPKPFTVYLCGPITGDHIDHEWRNCATAHLVTRGRIRVLDPLRGKEPRCIENQGLFYKGVLASVILGDRDAADIKQADLILAHFPYNPPRQSIGSLMEMGMAHAWGKPIILCSPESVFNDHLFCRNFCTLERDFGKALDRIIGIADNVMSQCRR